MTHSLYGRLLLADKAPYATKLTIFRPDGTILWQGMGAPDIDLSLRGQPAGRYTVEYEHPVYGLEGVQDFTVA
jgi:hypothetical protein